MKQCQWCHNNFEILEDERLFLQKISPKIAGRIFPLPEPILCSNCRHMKRMVWRNERFLYRRSCDLCKKNLISMYPPQCKFPVYCPECFWSDEWDPLAYGQEINFNRSFFDQFAELYQKVPQLSIFQTNCVNSEFCLNCIYNKNCYLISGGDYNEDCLYAINSQRCKNCIDHYLIYDCELCYGCIDSSRLNNCVGCQESEACSDCFILYDCKGCTHCAFSSNLRNKKYVLFNEQLSEEQYMKKGKEIMAKIFEDPFWLFNNLKNVRDKALKRANLILNSENCLGNNLRNCKNVYASFDGENLQDCRYCFYALEMRDCCDSNCVGWSELTYEFISGAKLNKVMFSTSVVNASDICYCRSLWNSKNCFGSTSLHGQNKYVILNRQYGMEDYERLVSKLIEHMIEIREWGQFFPEKVSPFEYNRSMANDYVHLSKDEALKRGFKWHDGYVKQLVPATFKIPITMENLPDSVVKEILLCESCGENYRIITEELNFHRKIGFPLPRICWACRLKNMIKSRREYLVREGHCDKCNLEIKTSFEKEAKNVYCEKCYLEAVY